MKGTKEFFLSKITKNKEKILVIKKAVVYLHRNQTTDRAGSRKEIIKNMKTFKNFTKAFQFVSLFIEGTYGNGFTLRDLEVDKLSIKDDLKYFGLSIVVIRETGSQSGFQTEEAARVYAKKWSNSVALIIFRKNENKEIEIESIKL